MKARNIVIGQRVEQSKAQRAKELRHRMTQKENIAAVLARIMDACRKSISPPRVGEGPGERS
uniref:Uncharacterized protein n=2 Tax=Candidatus Bipolaricaulota TaxID=67810 RepID=H5SP29_9BACT|nr:hypothetical protein HGMM_F52F12C18 [uncultured Acetothermia bacterium]BAL59038.1 hypothetical protein HGMM_OP3C193 [Candidatus Acetothermum autotrophicum]